MSCSFSRFPNNEKMLVLSCVAFLAYSLCSRRAFRSCGVAWLRIAVMATLVPGVTAMDVTSGGGAASTALGTAIGVTAAVLVGMAAGAEAEAVVQRKRQRLSGVSDLELRGVSVWHLQHVLLEGQT